MLTTVNPKEPERGPVDPDPEVPGPRHPDPNFPQPGDPPKLPTPVTDPPPSEPQPKPFVPLSPEMSCDMKEEAKANLPATQSADWSEHEHVSTQVQLQAEKLVEMVGTPELAKHAIRVVEQRGQRPSTGESESTTSIGRSRS